MLCDYSSIGMKLEVNSNLDIGDLISIENENLPKLARLDFLSRYLGEVKWCLQSEHDYSHFIVGIKLKKSCIEMGTMAEKKAVASKSYPAALVVTAALLPGVAAFCTVIIFLLEISFPGKQTYAPLWGSVTAFLAWLILTVFFRRFANAKFAVPSSYGELKNCLAQLRLNVVNVCQGDVLPGAPYDSLTCIREQIERIEAELLESGLSWALGRGYSDVWKRLHLLEEAMIEIEPQETVIAGALTDLSRLQGSKIDNHRELAGRILQAVNDIAPSSAVNYFQCPAAAGVNGVLSGTPEEATAGTAGFNVRPTDSNNVSVTKTCSLTNKASIFSDLPLDAAAGADLNNHATDSTRQARAILRSVRHEINEFRNGCWRSIIVARNRLVATMMLTGLTAYLVLAIAIIMGASRQAIAAASTFYLVGATIGLLNQLRSASQNDSAVEDYGLSTARLITMPLFSGLAAIGGVFLVTLPHLAGSYLANNATLVMVTPSTLGAAIPGQNYQSKMEAMGDIPPYRWHADQGQLSEWKQLKASGDLLATVPKEIGLARSTKFTARVMDSAGATVERSFNLNVASAIGGASADQPESRIESPPDPFNVGLIGNIFDLHKNIGGLILAAVFGLTPGIFFDRLQQKYENYKDDLKRSEATATTPKPEK